VARAIAAGLTDCGARVTVYNRDAARAQALAERIECEIRPWEDRADASGGVLVNCTSVGMWPEVDASPLPRDALRPDCTVFDTVYRPRETRLLANARAAGCRTIDGLGMFIRQAAMQFEYWTQQAADYETLASAVADALDPTPGDES
jgi:shikimate 5-dehydrogenase